MALRKKEKRALIAFLSASANEGEGPSSIEYACDRLREFGLWSRQDNNIGKLSSSLSMFVPGSSGRKANICDDEAILVNSAVASLMLSDPVEAHVLVMYYLAGMPDYLIAEKIRCDRKKVRSLRCSGEGFVACYLRVGVAA